MAASRFIGASEWALGAAARPAPATRREPVRRHAGATRSDQHFTAMYATAQTPDWHGKRRMVAMLLVVATTASAMMSGLAAFQRF